MTIETKSLLFNALPLFAVSVAYAAVTVAVLPTLLRSRSSGAEIALATVFPTLSVVAFVLGVLVAVEQKPVDGHLWLSFALCIVALIPAALFFARRGGQVMSGERAAEAEARTTALDRELSAVTELSAALVHAGSAEAVGRTLIERASDLLGVEFGALWLVDAGLGEGVGVVARADGAELDWFAGVRIDLRSEPSGVASAALGGVPLTVFDADASALVSRTLAERTSVKSAAFLPLLADRRVLAVLVVASLGARRIFTEAELGLLQSLGNEAALALDRLRSSAALAAALEREQAVARIAARFREQPDIDSVLEVAVKETAKVLEAQRAFVRLGDSPGAMPVVVEWHERGLAPIGDDASRLAVSNLAQREGRTVAFEDIASAPALAEPSLGTLDALVELGSRSALATPISVFEETIGVFALHRTEPRAWTPAEIAVAEAVARETGVALHVARLLARNEDQLNVQRGLFRAAQHVTAELELSAVLQRLVDELAGLVGVQAADIYLLDDRRNVLRCAAVLGLPGELVGFEFPAELGLAGEAMRRGKPVISSGYGSLAEPIPHEAYADFTDAIVTPIGGSGGIRGVLGAGARGDRSFTDRDADVIGAFASLAALALRNAATFEERSRQARVQRGFSRISTVLGQPLSLTETLDAAAQAAAEALGGAASAVLMPRRDGTLELGGSFELPAAMAQRLEDGSPPAASVFSVCSGERRAIAAPSFAEDDRIDDVWKELARDAGFGALLALPLEMPRGDGCGVVLVFFEGEREFTDDDLELGRQLAQAARGALGRSEVYESERRARAFAQQLARMGSLLATELDPEAVLEEVAAHAPALLGVDACAIRVLEGDALVLTAASGEGVEELIGEHAPTAGPLSGDVFQSRTSTAVADASRDAHNADIDPVIAAGYRAYLGAALVAAEGAAHGVLALYARSPRQWRREEIEAVEALAANTSAALSHAELFTSVALDRERSYAILANIADGIVAVDRDSKVVLWNAAAQRITGVAESGAVGRTVEDVLQTSLASGTNQPGRLVAIRRGAEEVWLSVTEAVMRDPTGTVAGRIFAFRDISADRLVEEMKSEFVSAVSRELRGPLTSIYGFAETLLREDVLFGEEERQTFIRYIASESERLTSIVDALLNVARLDTGDLHVELAPTDVGSVVSEAVGGVQGPAANGHRFVVDVPDTPLAAQADRDKVRQILSVLLDNAVKFSPYGGTVTVAARRAGDSVEVSVEDEGVGIPRSEHERIFRKFYRRGDATSGTGIGLFIARGLVSAMGGDIKVESEEGKGAQFTFHLPVAGEAVEEERRSRV